MEVNEIDGVLSEASNTEGAASESNNTDHGALDETRAPRQPGVCVQLGDELRRSLMQLDEERRNIELEVAQLNEILNTDIGMARCLAIFVF